MGLTTLGQERATNPFLRELASAVSERPQAPRGTFDVLPDDADAREALEREARNVLEAAGYRRIETPAFEATELFARGVGEATDIVRKEMFTFEDQGGRSMTLRPEGTAPVCRAYVEHGMHKLPAAGEALVPVAVLPPRGAAGRALPPVLADRGGGDRLRRPGRGRRERSCCWPTCWTRSGSADCGCACRAWGPRRRAPRTARSSRPTCESNEERLARDVRERIDLNPLRAFDSDDPGNAGGHGGRRPGCSTAWPPTTSSTSPPVRALLDAVRRGLRGRLDAGARAGLLHAHGVRVRVRRAGSAERRRRRAGATTASWS